MLAISPYLYIGVAVVFAFSNLFSYMKGREHVGIEFAEFRTKVEAENERIRQLNERVRRESEAATIVAEKKWLDAVADLRRRPHVRVQSNCDKGVSTLPATSDKPGQAAAELRPDPEITLTVEQCETRVNNAVQDAMQVEHIRAWISDQRKASMIK